MTETEKYDIIARISSVVYDEIKSTLPEDGIVAKMVAEGWTADAARSAIQKLRSEMTNLTLPPAQARAVMKAEDRRHVRQIAWGFIWGGIGFIVFSIFGAICMGTLGIALFNLAGIGLIIEGIRRYRGAQ